MQNLWTVWGQVAKWEPSELVGIYDSEDKALEVMEEALSHVCADGSLRFYHAWVDTYSLNETMNFDT